MDPWVEILGVYRLPVTEELFEEQFGILYGYRMSRRARAEAQQHIQEQLASIVLVEAVVRNRNHTFDAGHFTQPQDGIPKDRWQVAWAEAYLTPDGESLAVKRWSDPPESGDLRIAFFLHYWQANVKLRTSYGDVPCPPVQGMPERLARLVPFETAD